jgi:hypothetical protein
MSELLPVMLGALWLLVLLLGVGVTMLLLQWRRNSSVQREQLETMQNDLRALCNAAVQVGERLNKLEQEFKGVQRRQQELGTRQDQLDLAEPEARTFEQAVKLVRKGASVEEIIEICDLSRGEAELIAMMHRLDKTP